MKKVLKFGLMLSIAFSGMMFTGCEGEEGDPGATGAAGEKGDKGDKGDDGVGLEDELKYGSITVTYTGTRPDEVAFTKTITYKFAPIGANDLIEYSGSGINEETGADQYRVMRFLGSVDDVYQENYINLRLNRAVGEGDAIVYSFNDFEVYSNITTDDFKYFIINGEFNSYASEAGVTGFSYDPATGALKFASEFTVPGENNDTGFDLNVSTTVDAKVFQNIGQSGGEE
ncbi:hypothetical protein [Dawidia soli]|uniref:Collagen-like protein n=1 Tax=Dawidia soli TaxID=2782352 RepID=A0AAP2GD10_9BACT|nr:hypothetical protein [Dawidia soli]MBT1686752.1 hypothetical protein [Dawidia soli]